MAAHGPTTCPLPESPTICGCGSRTAPRGGLDQILIACIRARPRYRASASKHCNKHGTWDIWAPTQYLGPAKRPVSTPARASALMASSKIPLALSRKNDILHISRTAGMLTPDATPIGRYGSRMIAFAENGESARKSRLTPTHGWLLAFSEADRPHWSPVSSSSSAR